MRQTDSGKELAMTAIVSTPRCDYGMACVQCGDALIAPELGEFVSEQLVLNFWCCAKCGCRFVTEACVPADAEPPIDSKTMETFFPSLLVA
jgi:hypothetical protein